jgi:Protein of unknown function (DUF2752)
MEVVTPPSGYRLRLAALGPISVGLGCCAGLAYAATHNPERAGNWYPACPLHTATGLWCPGCGMTRATARLLHGDIVGALSFNALTPIFLALIVISWWSWLKPTLGRRPVTVLARIRPKWWTVFAFGVVAFGVARNIPLPGFRSLAP